ncbi:MAG: tRNA (guanosine(37)-N1)-methyltransferase TrmD [Chloroflexi bacterium]|nr:tRNA (guanosine(37)-N1)-methyltransferase TrmD [Chloroflexota bacterium]
MHIHIFTLFPSMFNSYLDESILKRAQQANLISVHLYDIRAYTTDKHHVTDDAPYGGGGGMVMKAEPIFAAVEAVSNEPSAVSHQQTPIILLSPLGRTFNQEIAKELAQHEQLMLICGRYEGVDERVREHLVTDEISIGDYVLTGGELPAMIMVDAIARYIPNVLGAENAASEDSFATGLLEYPHYTRPPEFRGWAVPEILQSGDHAKIAKWRRQQALRRTLQKRPDLLASASLSEDDKKFLATLKDGS